MDIMHALFTKTPFSLPHPVYLLLSTMDKQPLLKGLEVLGSGLASASTKDQLRPQLPLLRNVPVVLSLAVNDGIVMLEVGTEAGGLESDPGGVLVHGGGVLGPGGEVVGVQGEGLLEAVYGLGVFEEEDLVMLLV